MTTHPALLALVTAAVLIAMLCLAFELRWETNDDVGMSMVAHGYGLAAYGVPHLIFSNVLWGYFVRTLPSLNGVLGYSLATLIVLFVFGWATLYFLLRLGVSYLVGVLAITLLLARPTLFPQFTINAGLLTIAAVIGWQIHGRFCGLGSLFIACLLAFFGYLVRSQEFFLVLGVALPFLPWRTLRDRRQMQVAFLLLGLAIVSAAVLDSWAYSGREWEHFRDLNPARARYTDFGADKDLKQCPEIMARNGFSSNDVDLIRHWFFVDSRIANPKSLNKMLAELGPTPFRDGRFQSGLAAVKMLIAPELLPLLVSAVLLLVMAPRCSVALAWVLCLAALFTVGVMGRPVLRVYIPLVSLLVVFPLVVGQLKASPQRWLASLVLLLSCVANAYLLIPEALAFKQARQQVHKDFKSLPFGTIVTWGDVFPFELAFPVFANDPVFLDSRLYALGCFTLAPFSVHSAEQKAGRGIIQRLEKGEVVTIIASQPLIDLLCNYCKEHLKGELFEIATWQTPSLTVRQVRFRVTDEVK